MAVAPTMLADVIVPEIFVPYVQEKTAELSELVQSGILVRVPELGNQLSAGGKIIQMPFWHDLSGTSQLVTSGMTANVNKITTGQDIAHRLLRQNGWGAEDLAGMLAGSDPMRAIGNRVADWWQRADQLTVISALTGIFGSSSMSANTLSIFKNAAGAATSANCLNGSTFIDATQILGDAKGKLTAVVMHSATEAALLKLDLIDYVEQSDGKPRLKIFQGLRIVVDDGCPTSTVEGKTVYTTYLFGQGAVGWDDNTAIHPIDGGIGSWYQELERRAGNGLSIMYSRRDFVIHPRGVAFIGYTGSGVALETPTDAELATGANWNRVYEPKNVRLVRVLHNNLAA